MFSEGIRPIGECLCVTIWRETFSWRRSMAGAIPRLRTATGHPKRIPIPPSLFELTGGRPLGLGAHATSAQLSSGCQSRDASSRHLPLPYKAQPVAPTGPRTTNKENQHLPSVRVHEIPKPARLHPVSYTDHRGGLS